MDIDEFEGLLRKAVAQYLPEASSKSRKQRSIILRSTITIDEATFIQVYHNALTEKTSYALIHDQQRVMGHDNYKFWHYHPLGEVQRHIPCEKPSIEEAIIKMSEAAKQILG